MVGILLVITALFSNSVHALTLLESYNRIVAAGSAVGYVVQRYSTDPSGKITSVAFTHTNLAEGGTSESIKAVCDKKFTPISFSYTAKLGNEVKLIDAHFKPTKPAKAKGKSAAKAEDKAIDLIMDVSVTEKGKTTKQSVQLKGGVFLSQFLVYLMLTNPKGLTKGVKYNYEAIAEETGNVLAGDAFVDSVEVYKGYSVSKVVNNFNKVKYISLVTSNGELLLTQSPDQNLTVEMVKDRDEATKGFPVDTKSLTLLFGNVPKGDINVLAKQPKGGGSSATDPQPVSAGTSPVGEKSDTPQLKEPTAPAKGSEITPGKGVYIKGGSQAPKPAGH